MAAALPFSGEEREGELAGQGAFEGAALDLVGLLAEAEPSEQACGGGIQGVGGGGEAAGCAGGEEVVNKSL